jgi:ABC-type sugar transport system ATPase subunit
MGVIYITHRLEELRAVGDRVTILRDGRTVQSGALAAMTTAQIIHSMVGREVSAIYRRDPLPPGDELLRVEHLTRRGKLQDMSFALRAGEIVGLAGLIGAGRTELCRAIFGLDPTDSGEVLVSGRKTVIGSPRDAVDAGIALLTEDRQKTGLALRLPIATNVTMANLGAVCRMELLDLAAEARVTSEYVSKLRNQGLVRSAASRKAEWREPAEGSDRQMAVPE